MTAWIQIVFVGNSIYIQYFIFYLDIGLTLIVETKGQCNDNADLKANAAERWVDVLNQAGSFGLWRKNQPNCPKS